MNTISRDIYRDGYYPTKTRTDNGRQYGRHCRSRSTSPALGCLAYLMLLIFFVSVSFIAVRLIVMPPKTEDVSAPTAGSYIYNQAMPAPAVTESPAPPPAADTQWNLQLVNKWNPLPENYQIRLAELPGGEQVDERIYEALMEMLDAARESNWDQQPIVVSGYRSQEKQQQIYDDKIRELEAQGYSHSDAVLQTEQLVAVPGYSEHQLGLSVDINGATYDVYFWLQENSYKYGFIFRYPGSKSELTGISEEVWHYRYVGVDADTEMYNQGLCLEEYLETA